jgi:hypothetical protein
LATWNVRSLYRPKDLRITVNELKKYKIALPAEEEAKDQLYEQLERAYAACPSHDVKLMMGDANEKLGRESVHQPTIGKYSLHESTMASDWSTLLQAGK